MDISSFTMAFREGAKFKSWYGTSIFRTERLCSLLLTSGRIVVCDSHDLCDRSGALEVGVAPGEYPVILSIAVLEDTDQRVACAMIRFQEQMPVRFSIALTVEQSGADLAKNDSYCVDSATGCFTDADNLQVLDKLYTSQMLADLDETYVHTWSWANLKVNPTTGGNVVAFSTGFGDGTYSSYFGWDECDTPVCLVTDFGLFDTDDD